MLYEVITRSTTMQGNEMKEAIVLLNMGGPNNLEEVEVFLTNMFNDPNIITVKVPLLRRFIATMISYNFV